MNTLQDDWRDFKNKVYPKGMTGDQNLQLHTAFMAGALCYSQQIDAIASLPNDESIGAGITRLKHEVWEINQNRAHTAKDRN